MAMAVRVLCAAMALFTPVFTLATILGLYSALRLLLCHSATEMYVL